MIFDRVMGSETEFGVICPQRPRSNETVLSTLVVDSCPLLAPGAADSDWDYSTETPLQDVRGHVVGEEQAHPTQLTHRAQELTSEDIARQIQQESPELFNRAFWEQATMNRVLPNGARFYVDHAHPEYSAPETSHPWDALVWDAAGDLVGSRSAAAVAEKYGSQWPDQILLYKNNTDNKSVSYGYHENYLVPRGLDFQKIARGLIPFFASRIVVIGAGRAGIGTTAVRPGFQISQRADFFERRIGLETTIRRPLVNTRDEPHAVREKYRRLHVIPGDSNLSQTATLLKFAMTSAVLTLIEQDALPELDLVDPVAAMQSISHDPTLQAAVELTDGRRMTGVQLQRAYLDAALDLVRDSEEDLAPRDHEVFRIWQEVIQALETDPMSLADRLDWVAKYALVCGYRDRGLSPQDPKVQALDLQYADLRPEKSLYARLLGMGRMRRLVPEEQVLAAVHQPPQDTRAWLRGRMVRDWPDQVISAGWDVLALQDPETGRITRWLIDEPQALGRDQTAEVLDSATSAHHAALRLGLQPADRPRDL